MDLHTFRALEFQKIVDLIQGCSTSELGSSITPSSLTPKTLPQSIQTALRETTEFVNLLKEKGHPPISGLKDVRPFIRKSSFSGTVLEPRQLLDVASLLKAVRDVKNYVGNNSRFYPLLASRAELLEPLEALRGDIHRCIGEDATILDSASPRLARLRQAITRQRGHIRALLENIMARWKDVTREELITVRNGRYVIPLRKDFRKALDGIVHDKSQSGNTFFVEPSEAIEHNNRLANLIKDEEAEIYRILRQLTENVKARTEAIAKNCAILAELDFICAKASFSIKFGCCEPIINGNNYTHLIKARHPLLIQKSMEDGGAEGVVPLTISIGESYNTLLVSGPNTGGKTVAIKTVGLLNLMAQAGCHIPAAEGSNVGIFKTIFADIGDEQSIEQSLSSFSSHMKNIIEIVTGAQESSLVLLDELGSGTDPSEGAALGIAILEHLNGKKVRTIATTHHDLLKAFVDSSEGMENASFEFDVQDMRPTYRFLLGVPGGSNAIEVAARLGLPENLWHRAKLELGESRLRVHEFISQLKGKHKALEEEREMLASEKGRLQNLKERYLKLIRAEEEENEKTREALQREVKEFIARSREQIKAALREVEARTAEKPSDAPVQLALSKINKISRELPLDRKANEAKKGDLHKGDPVYISGLGLRGSLVDEPTTSGRVQVRCDGKTFRVPLKDLKAAKGMEPDRDRSAVKAINYEIQAVEKPLQNRVSIIGKTVEEALPLVDKALDDALVQGLPSVIIVHGVGTGKLKESVERLLSNHPLMVSYRPGAREEGGRGVTVVEL